MLLNIKPIHIEGLDCLEDLVISLVAYYHKEYELAFSEAWGFTIAPETPDISELLGDRIGVGNTNILPLVERYCGISVDKVGEQNADKVISVIKTQLDNGIPTGIHIDSFWCPWHSMYQRIHNGHFCLAIGLDEYNNIYCIDPPLNQKVSMLTYNDFRNGSGAYLRFDSIEVNHSIDYKLIFNHSITRLIDSDFVSGIKNFAVEFGAKFDFTKEYSNFVKNPWFVSIDRNIKFISGGRTLYAVFLDYLSNKLKSHMILEKKVELQKAASKWNLIRGLLTKSYLTGFSEAVKTKIINIISEIVDFEYDLLKQLLQIAQNIENENTNFNTKECKNLNYCYDYETIVLDLVKYFNNKGFASAPSDKIKADFSNTGYFFINKGFPNKELLQVENMTFKLPDLGTEEYDNISCSGQEIFIEKGLYNGIMFLGCSEYGNFIDSVLIRYENGAVEKIQVAFTDYWGLPVFDEVVAWVGNGGQWVNNVFTPHDNMLRIYAKKQPIEKNGLIEGIVLPDCPNMHIFAISLQKAKQ